MWSFLYNAFGRRTKVTDARGNTFTTEYDANGNVLKTYDADNNVLTEAAYNNLNLPQNVTDATGKTLTYSYNVLGKINTVTDQFGNTQTYGYDVCGRNNKVTDDLGGVSEVEYDLLGNVTRLKGPLGGATNYTYDQMGRLTSESTTSGGTIRYQYNELNLRKNLTNARGHIIHFSYDKNGRIDGYTTPEDVVTFEYDDNGNITRTRSGDGDIHRTFDELNRVTSYTDICCNRIGYEYDEAGNLKKLTYPDNTSVSYEYDENNNLKKVTDWAGRVTEYTYDKNNRVIGIVKPNGTTVTTTYERNKVKTTVEKTAAGAVITGFEYTYDNLSRVTEEKVLANSTKICYNYDDLSRVTSRTIKNSDTDEVISTENFTYDAAGNITGGSANTTFVYDTNNRLITFNGHTVEYDCDGNMLSNGVIDCGYDSLNRLVYTDDHDYIYDAENVRIRNFCSNEETSYVYNTNCKLSQLLVKTTNGVTTKYVYGLGLIGEEVNNTFKTYHFDSRGSTIAITDASGNITDTFAYDTYGKQISHVGTSDIIFGYNGRDGVVTDKNGLIYMRARYYSPDMRRFINSDIVAGKINNAVTLNRYAYGNANPVMNIDPLGLSCPECNSGMVDPSSCGCSKPKPRPSTNYFGNEEKNGQVVSRNEYYGVTNGNNSTSKNQNKQTQKEERDYEAELIAKKNSDDSINAPEGDWSWNNDSEYERHHLLAKNQQSTYDMVDNTLSGVGYAWDIGSPYIESAMVKSLYNAPRPNNIGAGTYSKMLKADEAFIRKGVKYTGYGLTGVTTIISTGMGIEQNIQNGESAWEIGTDAAIDIGGGIVAIGTSIAWDLTSAAVIGKIGAAIGTTISPGVGTAIGIGLGIGVGLLYDNFIDPMLDNML